MQRQYFAAAFLVGIATCPVGALASCADLSLVLAIDTSSSIDRQEFALQMLGYAAAFGDPGVVAALHDAGDVDVAAVLWADSHAPTIILPWARIASEEDALELGARLITMGRRVGGNTDIGEGLSRALDLIAEPGQCGARAVVNVSGDGKATREPRGRPRIPLSSARHRAEQMGVTVNGLAILNSEPDLEAYYRDELMTGPGSFVMAVRDFPDFAAAIARKLQREIAPQVSAALR